MNVSSTRDEAADKRRRTPRVDIGMPTRGRGPYIRDALESILSQTFTDWRLVISENGPRSQELATFLEPYLADPRVEYQTTGVDLGLVGNHNRVIQQGDAPYVAILHDDDIWESRFLERRVAFLDEHDDVGFVFGLFHTIDERGEVIARAKPQVPPGRNEPEVVFRKLMGRNIIGMPTIVVRRSAYHAVGAEFAPDIPMIDYEMWCRIAARFPVGFLPVADASWRWHSRQTSQRVAGWGERWLRFFDHLEAIVAEHPERERHAKTLARRRAASALVAAVDALEVGDRDRARRHLSTALKTRRRSIVNARTLAIAIGLVGGRPGARAAVGARRLTRRARGIVGPARVSAAEWLAERFRARATERL